MRVKFNPQAQLGLSNSEYVIKDFPFILDENTVLEFGMGKGEMLTQLAVYSPQTNYIGVEKNATIAHKATTLFEEKGLQNAKIIVDDINNILTILKGTVKLIYITFPDPWPKNRHEKRRLTYKSFLKIYAQILEKNGTIKFKTDNDKLYEYTIESLMENGWDIISKTRDLHKCKQNLNNFQTSYEKKWVSKNKNINYIETRYNGK